jgi:putative ABC transport system permease protein
MIALLRQLSWPELRHHPWRNLAALLAVMLGVALAFSVHLINASALSEFSAAVRSVNGEPDFELRAQRGGFDEALYARVTTHPDIAVASPVVEIDTYALDAAGKRVAVRVLGLDALVAGAVSPALMPQPAGSEDRGTLLSPEVVFLNATAREALGHTGDVRLQTPSGSATLRIAGTVGATGAPLVVMDIAGAQATFGWLGRLSRIDVRLADGADRTRVEAALALPAGVRAAAPEEAAQRVSNVSRAYRVNLTVLALVALFTGAFLVFSILSLSVAKRQAQFALLGVLGLTGRQRLGLVVAESALLGAVGSALGVGLGTALAATALTLLAGDLGGGYFPGVVPRLQFSATAALLYGGLGVLAAVVGGWLPARSAQRLAPALALKGLGAEVHHTRPWAGPLLMLTGTVLALLPPVAGVPLAAYAAVACLLLGGIAWVPAGGLALMLRAIRPPREPLALLAVERARHQRNAATVAVAGVVASLSLAVALTVMVASFRDAVTQWLDTVLPADLYVRAASSSAAGDLVALPDALVQRAGSLPGVARAEAQRVSQVLVDSRRPAITLIARPLTDPARELPLTGDLHPLPKGAVAAYVSEAMVDLYRATPARCSTCRCPMARTRRCSCGGCGATTRASTAR